MNGGTTAHPTGTDVRGTPTPPEASNGRDRSDSIGARELINQFEAGSVWKPFAKPDDAPTNMRTSTFLLQGHHKQKSTVPQPKKEIITNTPEEEPELSLDDLVKLVQDLDLEEYSNTSERSSPKRVKKKKSKERDNKPRRRREKTLDSETSSESSTTQNGSEAIPTNSPSSERASAESGSMTDTSGLSISPIESVLREKFIERPVPRSASPSPRTAPPQVPRAVSPGPKRIPIPKPKTPQIFTNLQSTPVEKKKVNVPPPVAFENLPKADTKTVPPKPLPKPAPKPLPKPTPKVSTPKELVEPQQRNIKSPLRKSKKRRIKLKSSRSPKTKHKMRSNTTFADPSNLSEDRPRSNTENNVSSFIYNTPQKQQPATLQVTPKNDQPAAVPRSIVIEGERTLEDMMEDMEGDETLSMRGQPNLVTTTKKNLTSKDRQELVQQEILTTEKAYTDDLRILSEVWKTPLSKIAGVTRDDILLIFSNLDMLTSLNLEVYEALSKEMEKTEDRMFGKIFNEKMGFFKAYKPYCIKYDSRCAHTAKLRESNKLFNAFILKSQNEELRCKGLDLNGWLIMPVQRIMKYPLVLKELMKYTPPMHPDFPNLQKAVEDFSELVDELNELKRHQENQDKIMSIQMSFSNFFLGDDKQLQLLQPRRIFIMEGKYRKGVGGHRAGHYYLFNDCVVFGRLIGKKENFHVSRAIKLKHIQAVRFDNREKASKVSLDFNNTKTTMFFDSHQELIAFCEQLMYCRQNQLKPNARATPGARGSIALWSK